MGENERRLDDRQKELLSMEVKMDKGNLEKSERFMS